jgi:hypothetical protein
LAAINRRDRPTMVSGLWDCVGMLVALGGVLLVVAPVLLDRFFLRLLNQLPFAEETFETKLAEVMQQWWFFWGLYFTLLLVAVFMMLWWRRNKTVIYNVDPEMFGHVLHDCLERLGLASSRVGDRLVIAAKSPSKEQDEAVAAGEAPSAQTATPMPPRAGAELVVEVFPPMCNVSLHWLRADVDLRAAIENHLARALDVARTFDNPAANWFMGLTGLLFGLVFLTGMIWAMTAYFLRHW